ncbi:hypothetical protein Y046_3898 [Burkholderia pseudomallei MSHR2990]|nr:hypothetical protein Y046_3898 [Burkholderia pseudomallei MSHR2990]
MRAASAARNDVEHAPDADEKERDEEDREQRRADHAAEHPRADRDLRAGCGARRERERQHADAERERGHHDRPQPQPRGLERRVGERHALRDQILRDLDDQDRVLRGQTDRRDQPHLEIDVVRHPAQRDARDRADHAERHDEHHRERNRPALVQRREREEHDEHRQREQHRRLRARQPLLVRLAGPRVAGAGGQRRRDPLDRRHRLAAAVPGRRRAVDRKRRKAVVARQLRRAHRPVQRRERRERHHLALRVAHAQLRHVGGVEPVPPVRLHDHAAHLRAVHEIADVVRAEHHSERRVDFLHRYAERRRLRAIDVELQLRRVLRAGEHQIGQDGVLAPLGEQLLARGDERAVAEPAAVLQPEVEAARQAEVRQRRHVDREHHRVRRAGEMRVDLRDDRLHLVPRPLALLPVLHRDEDHPAVRPFAVQVVAAERERVRARRMRAHVFLDAPHALHRLGERRALRANHHHHEVALILVGQERGRQLRDQQRGGGRQRAVDDEPAQRALEHPPDAPRVAVRRARDETVEPAEEAVLLVMVVGHGLEQRRAERRRERQREKRREADRHRQRERELPVDVADRAAEERHRHEHRREHDGDPDDRAADLLHRLHGGLVRRQLLLDHQPLDVLDDDDRVVDEDADREHHPEHRQHVDREARGEHRAERAEQRDGHDKRRNQRRAEVLHEEEHHSEHEHARLDERRDDLAHRHAHERRRLVRNLVLDARRKELRELLHRRAHALFGGDRIRTGRELDAHARRRLAVHERRVVVIVAAELDSRDVAQVQRRAVGARAQRDRAERVGRRERRVGEHGRRDRRAVGHRAAADVADRHARVVRAHGRRDIGRRQAERRHLHGVRPDPHRILGAPELHLADALDAPQRLQHVRRRVFAELHAR